MTADPRGLRVVTQRARSTATFVISRPVADLPAILSAVVDRLPRLTLRTATAVEATLTSRVNWATWGEETTLSFIPVSGAATEVRAVVVPALRTTVIDYGQGARDLRALYAAVATLLGETAVSAS